MTGNQSLFSIIIIKKEFNNIPVHFRIKISLIILLLLSSHIMSHKHDFDLINSIIVTTSPPSVLLLRYWLLLQTWALKTWQHRRERCCRRKVSSDYGTACKCWCVCVCEVVQSSGLNLNPHNIGTALGRCRAAECETPNVWSSLFSRQEIKYSWLEG